ncbi:hypothetical protein OAB54_06720, partial [Flavobacteriaceae bacterium]|nr:hypothetical protein [Flavobacteriaceae bacterium]
MNWNLKAHNKRIILKWGIGFAVLFLFNVFVEVIILPFIDLDNSPRNDIYFQVWWLCVVLWLVFGFRFLN